MHQVWSLSLSDALLAIDAGQQRAAALGLAMSVAVVDPAGGLIALHTMDGTQPAGADVAIGKARAAALFRRSSASFELLAREISKPSILLLTDAVDRALPVGGGLPFLLGAGTVVGAVGVSGGQDIEVAERAVAAVAATLPITEGASR